MKQSVQQRRQLRIARVRRRQARLGVTRLVVHVTGKHTYAQIISPAAGVLLSASTVEKEMRGRFSNNGGNVSAATAIGERLAEKAQAYGVEKIGKIGFDRGFRRYDGRIKALAEAARAGGLVF